MYRCTDVQMYRCTDVQMYRCTSFSDVTDVHMSQMFRCTSFFICHNYIFGDTYVSDTYRRIQKDTRQGRTGTCTFGKLRTFLCSTYQHSKTKVSRQCSWNVCLPFFAIRITYSNVYNVNVQNRIRRRCYGLKILLTIPCNHLRLNFLKFINFPWTVQRLFQRYPETQITRVPQRL